MFMIFGLNEMFIPFMVDIQKPLLCQHYSQYPLFYEISDPRFSQKETIGKSGKTTNVYERMTTWFSKIA